MHGNKEVATTVYSTHVIPDWAVTTAANSKKNYRPNNFMAGMNGEAFPKI